jgi:hypothetical protein
MYNAVLTLMLTVWLPCCYTAAQDADTVSGSRVPPVAVGQTLLDGDTVPLATYPAVYIFPEPTFKTQRQQKAYTRLVRNVKKVLPIAKEVNGIIIETYETMVDLPDDKSRRQHVKQVEKELFQTYKPRLKKLTFSQGKLLIKLIDREANQSAYEAVKAFTGSFRANFWQAFAWLFGASLKKEYDPEGEDRLTEQVVLQVEAGQL